MSGLADTSEQPSLRDSGCGYPNIYGCLHPLRHRNHWNMAAFADEIDDSPVILSLLQVRELQIGQFAAPKPTAEQHRRYGAVSLSFECVRRRELPEAASLVCCKAISQPYAQLLDPALPPYPGRQFGAEKAAIGGFAG